MNVTETRWVGMLCTMMAGFVFGLTACSSTPNTPGSDPQALGGPTVLFARTEPGMIELNRELQPMRTPTIVADVKDFKSRVTDVKLQFANVPLEIPMKNVAGTTWQAEFTPRQLEMLAVSGKTMKYDAQIIAKNEEGQIAMSKTPVQVQIKAPKVSTSS